MNTWLLIVSAIVLFVIAPIAYFWYYYQTRQLAGSFLARADQLLIEKKPREAAEYLQRYLQIKPKDSKIRVRLAETYDESAPTGKDRAIDLYYQALTYGENEGNADLHESFKEKEPSLHRRLGELLRETRQYAEAEKEASKLLELVKAKLATEPQNKQTRELQSQATRLLALVIYDQCKLGTWKKSNIEKRSASEILEQALKMNPGDRELSQTLARIYRDEPRWLSEEQQSLTTEERNQRADRFVEDLVQAHPKDPELLLWRYRYREKYHLPNDAEALRATLKAEPQNLEVLTAEARAEQLIAGVEFAKLRRMEDAKPHFELALEYYRQVLKLKPEDEDAFVNAGGIQQQLGKPEEALQTCRAGIEKNPNSVGLNLIAAQILLDQNRPQEAARADQSQGKEGPLEQAEHLIEHIAILINQQNSLEKQHELQQYVAGLQQSAKLLRGIWHFQQGNLQEALPLLQQITQGEKRSELQLNEVYQAFLLLGEIYSRIGQPEQAAKYYEDLTTLNPRNSTAHQTAANAWESLGRLDLAEKHRRQALEFQDTALSRYSLARMLFRQEMQKPQADRQWDAFEKALNLALEAKVEPDSPLSWQRELLAIQAAHLRNQDPKDLESTREQTLQKLQSLEKNHPQTPALLRELVLNYDSLQVPAEADRASAELVKLKPQEAETYLVQAKLAVQRHNADGARAALAEGIQKVSAAEKSRLQRAIIQFDLAENREADAAKQLEELLQGRASAEKNSLDAETLDLVLTFADQALNKRDNEAAKRWEDALLKLEGPEGSLWRYARARRLLNAAKDVKDPQFAEADRLQTELRKIRPSWAPGYLLDGIILQQRGKLEEAVDAYQSAIRLGYRQLAIYEPLVDLLNQLGRYAEAESCLAGLQGQVPGSLYLSSVEISRAAERGQWQQALELARRTAEAQPGNPQAALWLSRLLETDNQVDAAGEVLQKAVQSNLKNPGVHYQLLAYYVRNGKTEAAKECLEKLAENTEIPRADRTRLLAQGYELVQDDTKAEEARKTLAAEAKDTPAEQTALAKELLNRDTPAAEKALRRSLQLDSNYNAARLMLAGLLASRGGEAEWNEALSLVSGSLADPREERLRQTLQAQLYASRGGRKNLEQARELVEKLVSDPKQAQPEEILLLAKIYESEGNVEEAKTRLRTLVEASPNPPANQVAAYVELLLQQELPQDDELRQKLLAEKELWVKKLQKLAPDNPKSIALMARWLKNCDRQAEIEPLIEAWAAKQYPLVPKNPQAEIKFLDLLGSLYMSLEAYPAAERWYRKAVEKAADHYPQLARSLARQGRYEEALQLCQNAAEKDPSPLPVFTAASLLFEGQPAAKDFEQAEKLLEKAAESFRDQPNVLNILAAVEILQGRMEDATALYRRVLELRPRDVLAMNNLATVLSEQPDKLAEGKELIEKAIALAGPQAGLLDVKGAILLADNKSAQAVPVLEEAAAASQADPRYGFHLAVAYLRTGKLEKAREAFQRARVLKLDQQILTPGDKKLRAELEQALNKKSAPK